MPADFEKGEQYDSSQFELEATRYLFKFCQLQFRRFHSNSASYSSVFKIKSLKNPLATNVPFLRELGTYPSHFHYSQDLLASCECSLSCRNVRRLEISKSLDKVQT